MVSVFSRRDVIRQAQGLERQVPERGGTVSNYRSRDVKTVEAAADIVEVAEMFVKGPFRGFPAIDNGQLVGQFSHHDILKAIGDIW